MGRVGEGSTGRINWCPSFQSDHSSQLGQLFPSPLPLGPGYTVGFARAGPEGSAATARHPDAPRSPGSRLARARDLCAERTLGRGRRSIVAVRRGDWEGAAAEGRRGGVSTS